MPKPQSQIALVGPDAGLRLDVLGAPITIKSGGRRKEMFFADHPVPAGYGVPLHVHEDEDEAFYVLEGCITLDFADGATAVAEAGAFVHLPRGAPHGFRNLGPVPARMIVVATPGGALEGVFLGLDAAGRDGPLDPKRIGAICTANRVPLVLPA